MKILITGGLGFIGVNAAIKLSKNNEVYILDNFSRKGNQENLKEIDENKIKILYKDIRNFFDMEEVFKNVSPEVIIHLAGQVAVTTSVKNPREDFEINTLGTFNLLECIRIHTPNSSLLYASTNKVYGDFKEDVLENELKYEYVNINGIDEKMTLDFHSPYGCSKGSADQYVRDYSRTYGLKTVVLRQSCIYGENQFGVEDQGWVAWFTIAAAFNQEITIYGNGKQVRDILHVDDLVDLYEKIINNMDICAGKIYNVGGGPKNAMSILELLNFLKMKHNINYSFGSWRVGDQKIYISNIDKIYNDINWEPKIDTINGIQKLYNWVIINENKFRTLNLIK